MALDPVTFVGKMPLARTGIVLIVLVGSMVVTGFAQ